MRTHHILLLLLGAIVGGGNVVATKFVVNEFPPIFASAVRFGIAALMLVPFLRVVPGRMGAVLLACMNLALINFTLIYMGIARAGDMSVVAIVGQAVVPVSTVMAVVLLKEQIGWRRMTAIAMAFAGILVLGFDPRVLEYHEALLLILGGVTVFSYGTIQVRRLGGMSATNFLAWQALVALTGQLLLSFAVESGQLEILTSASVTAWTGMLYTAVLSTLLAHISFYYVLQRNPVNEVMPFTLLAPVFGVIFAVLILDEVLTARMITGGAIVFLGVAIISFRNRAEIAHIVADEDLPDHGADLPERALEQ